MNGYTAKKRDHLTLITPSGGNGILEPFDPNSLWNLSFDSDQLQRATARNIIDSYQGEYDLLIELVQNAVDAVEYRARLTSQYQTKDEVAFRPWVYIIADLAANELTVVDNGYGMDRPEVMRMLVPHLSFKGQVEQDIGCQLRGHKGVGACYACFGFNCIQIGTKGEDGYLGYEVSGGRDWALSDGGVPSPMAQPTFEVNPILAQFERGTAITVRLDKGTRPTHLSKIAPSHAELEMALRTRTAIGLVNLQGEAAWAQLASVSLTIIGEDGESTYSEVPLSYPWPHESPSYPFLDMEAYYQQRQESSAIPPQALDQMGLYRVWAINDLLHPHRGLTAAGKIPQLIAHNAVVYGFFAYSASLFRALSKDTLQVDCDNLDDVPKALRPGVWAASNNAIVGRSISLRLGYGAGNEDRLLMVVQLDDVRPDLGRKGLDPELEREIRVLGSKIISYFIANLKHLRPAGLQPSEIIHINQLHKYLAEAKKRRERRPLAGEYALTSQPVNEPEAIALFQEMLARSEIVGYRILSLHHNQTYDGVFTYRLERDHPRALYIPSDNPLGLSLLTYSNREHIEHPVAMFEFKTNMDALIQEFLSNTSMKMFEHISLVVVWDVGRKWKHCFDLLSLVEEGARTRRELHGTTHVLTKKGDSGGHRVHVIALKDVIELLHG